MPDSQAWRSAIGASTKNTTTAVSSTLSTHESTKLPGGRPLATETNQGARASPRAYGLTGCCRSPMALAAARAFRPVPCAHWEGTQAASAVVGSRSG
ncbi:hypothetical protein [Scytonema sp. PCC 10023]|uniref:hypothetical protein n=1 Tax=Scytonema sp. PCC 10023 TaxID=1680591 RepID=UPI0039C75FDE